MSKKAKIVLPVVNDKCPHCGSTERLGQDLLDEMRESGVLGPLAFHEGLFFNISLRDPTKLPKVIGPDGTFKVKVLKIGWDACRKCYALYLTKIEVVEEPAMMLNMPSVSKP